MCVVNKSISSDFHRCIYLSALTIIICHLNFLLLLYYITINGQLLETVLTAAFFVTDFASRDFVLHLENQTVRGVINLTTGPHVVR